MLQIQLLIHNLDLKKECSRVLKKNECSYYISKNLKNGLQNINKINIDILCIDSSLVNEVTLPKIIKLKHSILWLQEKDNVNSSIFAKISLLKYTLDIFFYNNEELQNSKYSTSSLAYFFQKNITISQLKKENKLLQYQLESQIQSFTHLTHQHLNNNTHKKIFSFLLGNSQAILQFKKKIHINILSNQSILLLLSDKYNNQEVEIAQFIHERKQESLNTFQKTIHKSIENTFFQINFQNLHKSLHALELNLIQTKVKEITTTSTFFLQNIDNLSWNDQGFLYKLIDEYNQSLLKQSTQTKYIYFIFSLPTKTNKLIEKNKFRQNLFSKISTHSIKIPNLNERSSDIIFIIDAITDKYKKKYKKMIGLSPYLKYFFLQNPWQDSYDEFYRLIEKILSLLELGIDNINIITEDSLLIKEKKNSKKIINEFIEYIKIQESNIYENALHKNIIAGSLQPKLADIEKMYILEIFYSQNKNYAKTARILNISRKTLYQKISGTSKTNKKKTPNE